MEIDLGAIFDGDIDSAMTVLNESRACGVEWKVNLEPRCLVVLKKSKN